MNDKTITILQGKTRGGSIYEYARVLLNDGTKVSGLTVPLHRLSLQQLKRARENMLKK